MTTTMTTTPTLATLTLLAALAPAANGLAQLSVPNGDFESTESVMLGDPCLPIYDIVQPVMWDSWYDLIYDDALIGGSPTECSLSERLTMTSTTDSHTGSFAMQMECQNNDGGFTEGTAQTLVFTNGPLGPNELPIALKGSYKLTGASSPAINLQVQAYLMSGEGELDLDEFLFCRQTFIGCNTQNELIVASPTLDLGPAATYTDFEMGIPTLCAKDAASVWVIILRFRFTGVFNVDNGALAVVDDLAFEFDDGCPDFSGDGSIGFADLTDLLAKWGPCPPSQQGCPWDLSGDCSVGFADLTELLSQWGPCL